MIKNKITWIIKGIIIGAVIILTLTMVAQFLWNQLVVSLFHAPIVNFWQMLGLMVLGRLLCGGFSRRMGGWGKHKNPMHQKWYTMTEEEKANMKAKWTAKKADE